MWYNKYYNEVTCEQYVKYMGDGDDEGIITETSYDKVVKYLTLKEEYKCVLEHDWMLAGLFVVADGSVGYVYDGAYGDRFYGVTEDDITQYLK